MQSGFYFFNQPAQRVKQMAGKGLARAADDRAHDLLVGQQPRLDKLGNDLTVNLPVVKPGIEQVLGALRRAKIFLRRALSGKRVEDKIAQFFVQSLALQQVRVFMRHRGENASLGLCPEVDYPVNGAAVEICVRVDEQDLPVEHLREPPCRRTFLGGNTMFKCTALGRVQISVRLGIAPPGFKDAPCIHLSDHGIAQKVKGVPLITLSVIRAEVGVVKLGRREQGVPCKSAQLVCGNARGIARIIDSLPGGADRSTHLFARVRGLQRRHTRIGACVAQLLRRKGLHGFQLLALFGECAGQLLAGQRLKGIRKRLGFCDFIRAAVGQLAGKHVAEVRVRLRLRPFRRRLARHARRICRPELRLRNRLVRAAVGEIGRFGARFALLYDRWRILLRCRIRFARNGLFLAVFRLPFGFIVIPLRLRNEHAVELPRLRLTHRALAFQSFGIGANFLVAAGKSLSDQRIPIFCVDPAVFIREISACRAVCVPISEVAPRRADTAHEEALHSAAECSHADLLYHVLLGEAFGFFFAFSGRQIRLVCLRIAGIIAVDDAIGGNVRDFGCTFFRRVDDGGFDNVQRHIAQGRRRNFLQLVEVADGDPLKQRLEDTGADTGHQRLLVRYAAFLGVHDGGGKGAAADGCRTANIAEHRGNHAVRRGHQRLIGKRANLAAEAVALFNAFGDRPADVVCRAHRRVCRVVYVHRLFVAVRASDVAGSSCCFANTGKQSTGQVHDDRHR